MIVPNWLSEVNADSAAAAAADLSHHVVHDDILHVVAILAGVFILAGWVEQVCRGYRTKHLNDVSNYLMLFVGCGSGLWAAYGAFISDIFVAGMNFMAVLLVAAVYMMKKTYMRRAAAS